MTTSARYSGTTVPRSTTYKRSEIRSQEDRRNQMKNGYKVFDSDLHIMEPPDLWERYIDKEFKNVAPRGTRNQIGDLRLVHPDGSTYGMRGPSGNGQQRPQSDVVTYSQRNK